MEPNSNDYRDHAEEVASRQRAIQREQDAHDASSAGGDSGDARSKGVQAGAREHPRDLPAQHLEKPGIEALLELQPQFMAPGYRGSDKLAGFSALITGADSGIGRAVAVLFAREGADVAVAYLNEHEDAQETRRCVEAEGRRCILLPGDVKDPALLPRRRGKDGRSLRQARRAGQQRGLPGACRVARRPDRRALRRNAAHQRLRLLPHGARRLAAPEARQFDHQHRLGGRPRRRRQPARLLRRPRVRSTRSRNRWRRT